MFFFFPSRTVTREMFSPPLPYFCPRCNHRKKSAERICAVCSYTSAPAKEDAAPAHFISLIFALLAPRCLRFVFMNITFQKCSRFFSLSFFFLPLPFPRVQTKFASKTLTDDIFVFLKSLACNSHACLPAQLIMHALWANFRLIL